MCRTRTAEIRPFALKVEAGAEYAITQPVFDLNILEYFLRRVEQFRIPIIAGIWPLTSLKNADFMKKDLRVSMPDTIMARMAATTSPEASRAEGIQIAQEMLRPDTHHGQPGRARDAGKRTLRQVRRSRLRPGADLV